MQNLKLNTILSYLDYISLTFNVYTVTDLVSEEVSPVCLFWWFMAVLGLSPAVSQKVKLAPVVGEGIS